MSGYEDSLLGRLSFMLTLNATRIADVGVAVSLAAVPVLLTAVLTDTIGYAVVAILGLAVSFGSQIARHIFDAGGYESVLKATDDQGEPIDRWTLAIGIVYINLLVATATVAGVIVGQASPAAGVAVAMAFAPLDLEWGAREDRIAPVWWVTTAFASLIGSEDPLGRVRNMIWSTGGDIVPLFTTPRRPDR